MEGQDRDLEEETTKGGVPGIVLVVVIGLVVGACAIILLVIGFLAYVQSEYGSLNFRH
jgi:hypothetical protein